MAADRLLAVVALCVSIVAYAAPIITSSSSRHHHHVIITSSSSRPDRAPGVRGAAVAPPPPPSQLFVSPTGSDDAAGTDASHPVATLSRAQLLARAAIQVHGSVVVNVMPGTYRINATLCFSAADSGATWRGNGAVVTGSIQLQWSDFETVVDDPRLPAAAAGKVKKLKLSVDAGKGAPGMLYRDPDRLQVFARGERSLTLARWPDEGETPPGSKFRSYASMSAGYVVPTHKLTALHRLLAEVPPKPNAISFAGAPGAAGLEPARVQRWLLHGGVPQLAVHGAFRWQWADQMLRVTTIDPKNHTFVFESGCQALRYWPPVKSSPYYVIDLLQEISAGEFWLDRNTSELYVFEPAGFHVARHGNESDARNDDTALEITVPLSLPTGLSTVPPARTGPMLMLLDRVRNFRWDGIALTRSRGMAVLALNCSNITLHGVNATGLSGQAAVVEGGTNVTLSRWRVTDCGAGGVTLSGGDREHLVPSQHSLIDSELSHTDQWVFYEVPPINQQGVATVAANNYIHDVRHHAFRQGGNDHIVERNLVKDVLQECWDCGAYHTGRDLTWRGNIIRYNLNINNDSDAKSRFPCVTPGTSCLKAAWYFDDHMSGVTAHGNVVVGYENAVFNHFGRDNNVTQNIFIDCDLSVAMEACKPVPQDKFCDLQLNDTDPGDTMMTALRDAMEWPSWNTLWTKRYPALGNITWFPGSTVNNTISYNIAVGSTGTATIWNATNVTWRGGGYRLGEEFGSLGQRFRVFVGNWNGSDVESVGFESTDPLGDQNFALKETSPARVSMGAAWHEIPTAGYGPRKIT